MSLEEKYCVGIVEYAHLTKSSVSTVRRQIKKGALDFKVRNGRYFFKRPVNNLPAFKNLDIKWDSSLKGTSKELSQIYQEILLRYELLLEENTLFKKQVRELEQEKLDLKMLICAYEDMKEMFGQNEEVKKPEEQNINTARHLRQQI